ncbi:MAG: roadblock/LC7 domain-containing protein [Cyanobacteria bacterium P01_F01_bin.150]
MAINTTRLELLLQSFVNQVIGIQGAVIASLDGLPLASYLADGLGEDRLAAMSATMLSLGERIGQELGRGDINRLFVEGEKGYVTLTGCGAEAVLLVLSDSSLKQGVLMLEIKNILQELKTALS